MAAIEGDAPGTLARLTPGLSAAAGSCFLCGAPRVPWFQRGARHFERCRGCGLLVVPEGLARDASGVSIYEADRSIFEVDGNEGYYLDHEANLANCRLKLAWVMRDLAPGARLLDAGANYGHFLKVAQERYDAEGFDVSPGAVRYSVEQFAVRNRQASIYDVEPPEAPYDAVTLWDVVEHLTDPLAALVRLRSLVKPGGRLFLSTPDAGSLVARLLGRRWHYLDPVQHLTVFSRENLRIALRRCGFEAERWGSIGHSYRVGYVLDRLAYLHREGRTSMLVRAGGKILAPLRGLRVYLNPGDVVILTARAAGEGPGR
jgi:SAM-dependent methyltransferase